MRFHNYLNEIKSSDKKNIIKIFRNEEDGIESRVVKVERGYSVTLWDTDAEKSLDVAIIFPDKKAAIKRAKEIL